MKKNLLLIILLLLSKYSLSWSIYGGTISARNIGGLTYEINVRYFYDTTSSSSTTIYIECYNDSGSFVAFHERSPHISLYSATGISGYGYIDTITFPIEGNYNIFCADCCYNNQVSNMTLSNFSITNKLWFDSSNSSLVFLNSEVVFAQPNTPFNFNPYPFDADGDSLGYSLGIPNTWSGTPVPGYYFPPSDSSMLFSVDTSTCEITFLPNTSGTFQYRLVVSEYRNSIKIGETELNMPLFVDNFTSLSENLSIHVTMNIYPNPTNSLFIITSPFFIDQIEVTDVMGRIVYYTKSKDKRIEVKMDNEGLYFVTIISGDESVTKRAVVER